MDDPVRIGIVGCGSVSGQYLTMIRRLGGMEVVALADLQRERCEARAVEFALAAARIVNLDELLADPRVEVVANLTQARDHFPIGLRAIEAGKHLYNEKPLATTLDDARTLAAAARRRRVRVACAPDTFMGAGLQSARRAIDQGLIGRPVGFASVAMSRGVEHWHPNPAPFYQPGGGPLMDSGPYHLTALLNLLGPIRRVTALSSIAIPHRTVTAPGPLHGQPIDVTTPDHVGGAIEFASGCIGTIMSSYADHHAVHDTKQPIVIWGTEGTLKVPDPTGFDGVASLRRAGELEFAPLPHATPTGYLRGVGLADLCEAIRTGREPRAGAGQALAVIEAIDALLRSGRTGRAVATKAPYERPAPMVAGAGISAG